MVTEKHNRKDNMRIDPIVFLGLILVIFSTYWILNAFGLIAWVPLW